MRSSSRSTGKFTGKYSARFSLILNQLRGELLAAPEPNNFRGRHRAKYAAVLVPIFEREDLLHILFTRRSDRLASHQGQVAFPGGKFDPADQNLLDTALRESHEEVGIEPRDVEVLGRLEGFGTRASGFSVLPFVGVIPGSLALRPDPHEVAEIFSVPLEVLRDPRFRGDYKLVRNGQRMAFPAIVYGGQTIWGLTLRITERVLQLMERILSPETGH